MPRLPFFPHPVLLLFWGLFGCESGFWTSYAVFNPHACQQLMSACTRDATMCTSAALIEACGRVMQVNTTTVDTRLRKDVDILFVIDNSPSMAPKQKVLGNAIKSFISAIDGFGASYHVGIVTTDLGYDPEPSASNTAPWNTLPTCDTYAGDDGVLQNTPCTSRDLTGEAAAACTALCPDPQYVPASGARYIAKVDGVTNVPVAMNMGVDQGPLLSFQCMALVGDNGCGVEQPLEAAKRALDDHRTDNNGFNRHSSVLAVIFITDEDDCSVQLAQRGLMNPLTPGASSAACTMSNATPGVDPQCFNTDYRCLARSLSCTESLNTKGAKTHCFERTDSFLYPIAQYVNFFASLPNPKLIISGIWTPTMLDNLAADPAQDGQLYVDYVNGTMDTAGLNRARKTLAACYNPDPTLTTDTTNGFFGQAQLRLSSFIRRFQKSNSSESSICGDPKSGMTVDQSYAAALDIVATNINDAFGVDCLNIAPKTVDGNPLCLVGYVAASTPDATPDTTLPVCSATCCNYFATDPKPNAANDPDLRPNPHLAAELAACSADPDCYCAVPSQMNCGGAGVVAGLWRQGNAPPPAGKIVRFQCAAAPLGAATYISKRSTEHRSSC